MNSGSALFSLVLAGMISVSAHAQIARQSTFPLNRRFPQGASSRNAQPARAQSPHLSTIVSPDVIWVQCPPKAQALGATCGKLPVPFDRQRLEGGKIEIYFERYLHTSSGPAESAILLNPGGPGASITNARALVLTLFAGNRNVHDFLLIDDRGRGLSAAIECQELQDGTAPFNDAEADCAAQLGNADSRYGTGDVAMDPDAVRAALGYDTLDYWGASYRGEDVTAYATRFGQRLRSIVLAGPEGTPDLRAFVTNGDQARSTGRAVRLACMRSPTCSPDHPDPDREFVRLIEAVRDGHRAGTGPRCQRVTRILRGEGKRRA